MSINSLDLDQAPYFVWPDLGPNCLQKLSVTLGDKELTLILQITFCPENVVCFLHLLHTCIYSNTLQTTFDHGSKHYEPGADLSLYHTFGNISHGRIQRRTGDPDLPPPPWKITSVYRFSWKFWYKSPSRSFEGCWYGPLCNTLSRTPLMEFSGSVQVSASLLFFCCNLLSFFGEFLFWPFPP